MAHRRATTKGFARTSSLLEKRIRRASESRGFAQSRLLTHWEEIAGSDSAAVSRPVDVRYGRQGMGATLTLLTTGANAPILEMQKEALRAKVNAIYGYNAISRIKITQTSPTGFAEGRASFEHRPKRAERAKVDPVAEREATGLARGAKSDDLRRALEMLGRNVLSKQNN